MKQIRSGLTRQEAMKRISQAFKADSGASVSTINDELYWYKIKGNYYLMTAK